MDTYHMTFDIQHSGLDISDLIFDEGYMIAGAWHIMRDGHHTTEKGGGNSGGHSGDIKLDS